MIRILHSVSNMDRAGIETMLMNYYRHMDRDVIQFDFLCNKQKPGGYDDEIKEMGGRIFHTPGYKNYPAYLKFMKKLFAEHPEYKIVEGHNGILMAYALSGAKRSGVPNRIVHAHATSIPVDKNTWIKKLIRPVLPTLASERWACSNAAGVFYFNELWDKKPHQLIFNAIESDRFAFSPEKRDKLRKEYGLEDKFIIGHVGGFRYEKNHEKIIRIFSEIKKLEPNAHLVLVGVGELMDNAVQLVHSLSLDDSVLFAGQQSDTSPWYSMFDLFLMPSFAEGLPVVGVEAQAAGLPSLFSTGVTEELAMTEPVKFFSIEETDRFWAEKALEFKDCPRKDTRQQIKDAHYDIDTEAKRVQQLYVELYEKAGGKL